MNTLFLPLPGRSCFLLSAVSGTFPRSVFSTARFAAPTSCEVNHDDEP